MLLKQFQISLGNVNVIHLGLDTMVRCKSFYFSSCNWVKVECEIYFDNILLASQKAISDRPKVSLAQDKCVAEVLIPVLHKTRSRGDDP